MNAVCIIPARGGSKRIPRKNIRAFCGRPIIAWSIDAARASDCFESIVVSTDDDEIASVARKCGADVPFRRPAELADDHANTVSVVAHAVNWLQQQAGIRHSLVCCIYATAPLVRPSDLRRGRDTLEGADADYAFSVTTYDFPIQRALRIGASGRLEMLEPGNSDTRSQDLEEAWHDAGQFYWGRSLAWLNHKPIMTSRALPVPLPRNLVQDIDTLEDWACAEALFRASNPSVSETGTQ